MTETQVRRAHFIDSQVEGHDPESASDKRGDGSESGAAEQGPRMETERVLQEVNIRLVKNPVWLLKLLKNKYGESNFTVRMRHNVYMIHAPGTINWAEVGTSRIS